MGLSVLQITFHKNKKGFVEYLTPPWCSFQMNQLQLQQPQWRRRQQQPQRQQRRQPRVHPLLGLQWVRAKDLAINTLLTLKVVRVMFNQSNRDFKFEFLHCWSRQKPKLTLCRSNTQWSVEAENFSTSFSIDPRCKYFESINSFMIGWFRSKQKLASTRRSVFRKSSLGRK